MKSNRLLILISAVIIFQSCAPVYLPNTRQTPMFDEPGEIQLSGYHGTNGFDIQAAASVVDHFAVMGNAAFAARDSEDSTDYRKHHFYEFGLGYYDTFGEKGRFEFYGGYGGGKTEAQDSYFFVNNNEIVAKGEFNRFFLQGNLGLQTDVFEGAFSYRVAWLNYYKFEEVRTGSTLYDNNVKEVFLEPAITLKVGGEKVKFVSQFGVSFPYDDHSSIDYEPFSLSIGIIGKIDAW